MRLCQSRDVRKVERIFLEFPGVIPKNLKGLFEIQCLLSIFY